MLPGRGQAHRRVGSTGRIADERADRLHSRWGDRRFINAKRHARSAAFVCPRSQLGCRHRLCLFLFGVFACCCSLDNFRLLWTWNLVAMLRRSGAGWWSGATDRLGLEEIARPLPNSWYFPTAPNGRTLQRHLPVCRAKGPRPRRLSRPISPWRWAGWCQVGACPSGDAKADISSSQREGVQGAQQPYG